MTIIKLIVEKFSARPTRDTVKHDAGLEYKRWSAGHTVRRTKGGAQGKQLDVQKVVRRAHS